MISLHPLGTLGQLCTKGRVVGKLDLLSVHTVFAWSGPAVWSCGLLWRSSLSCDCDSFPAVQTLLQYTVSVFFTVPGSWGEVILEETTSEAGSTEEATLKVNVIIALFSTRTEEDHRPKCLERYCVSAMKLLPQIHLALPIWLWLSKTIWHDIAKWKSNSKQLKT